MSTIRSTSGSLNAIGTKNRRSSRGACFSSTGSTHSLSACVGHVRGALGLDHHPHEDGQVDGRRPPGRAS